ncbi:MAG: hypothetical protein L6R39_000365 [Caloplaca ligustica]|nr:MAG: hypothetical protein L6R39_000365 [Caloplaca ligustica]
MPGIKLTYTTDLTQSDFLNSLGYDLENITHESQLLKLHEHGLSATTNLKALQHRLALTYHHHHPETAGGGSPAYTRALKAFRAVVVDLRRKTTAHVATLEDMTARVTQQWERLFENLDAVHGVHARPPIAVDVESVFCPGECLTIVWACDASDRERHVDEWSTTADYGDEEGDGAGFTGVGGGDDDGVEGEGVLKVVDE